MAISIVLYTFMPMGHLLPMVELARLFHLRGATVTIAVVDFPPVAGGAAALDRLAAANLWLAFHRLPSTATASNSPMDFAAVRSAGADLLALLKSLPAGVDAVVIDFFCTDALAVARELAGVPSYLFSTGSASILSLFSHLPALYADEAALAAARDLGVAAVDFPGLGAVPKADMMPATLYPDHPVSKAFTAHFERFPKADGILSNTFHWLEQRAVDSLRPRPAPVFPVGPVVGGGDNVESPEHECLAWLDKQPPGSVVFLCFGSIPAFTAAQLLEMAAGLEASGQRFLWVVRSPALPEVEPLLEGLPARTGDRGMVVKSWAPQRAVLRHGAVGGFVTHCGWNSVLEAVVGGVPMVAWPLHNEQRLNRFFLMRDAGLAAAVGGLDGAGEAVVSAAEVERIVRWVMGEGAAELRKRAAMAKEEAAAAVAKGGSSAAAFDRLLEDIEEKRRARIRGCQG